MIAPHMNLKRLINKELSKDELLELIVDVSEIKINRPAGKASKNKHYSGKKKCHTAKQKLFVIEILAKLSVFPRFALEKCTILR